MFKIKGYISFFLAVILLLTSSCSLKEDTQSQNYEDGELIINDNCSVFRLVAQEADTLLPTANIPRSLAEAVQIIYEPLFDFDEALNPIPVLAESCTASDSMQYRVTLKQGVLWHDGTEFNANDVIYTFNSLKNSDSLFAAYVKNITEVDIISRYKVLFTLNKPVANFVGLLSFPIIKRNTSLEPQQDFVPVGTGPYKFSEKKNNTYYFEKNNNWQNGSASDKTVSITLLKDKQSAVYAFEANEADVISSELMDLTKNTPRGQVNVQNYLSNNLTFLGMNDAEGILSIPGIRQAISYLINKNEIVEKYVYGRGTAVDIPVYPKAWFYDSQNDMLEITADGDYLEALLNENGWFKKNGIYVKDFGNYDEELTLSVLVNRDNDEKMAVAQYIAQILGENGIIVKIKAVSYEQYAMRVRDKDFSMFIGEVETDKNMDPSKLVKSGENYFSYCSEEMDEILHRMGRSQSNEELIACFSEFAGLFVQDMPFVPLYFRENAIITASELTGFGMPNYYRPYRNIENWYFSQKVELNNK